jgi:hypothetical protein
MEDFVEFFHRQGVREAPIPERLRSQLAVRAQHVWSTRAIDPGAMYFFAGVVLTEALSLETADGVAVGHVGHGLNSYCISYFLVDGPLAVYAQVPWGGVYMDAKQANNELLECFDNVERLIELAHRSSPSMQGRVVVLVSPFREVRAAGRVTVDIPIAKQHAWIAENTQPEPFGVAARLLGTGD